MVKPPILRVALTIVAFSIGPAEAKMLPATLHVLAVLDSTLPAGSHPDGELTPLVCPAIGETLLSAIYDDLRSDALAHYNASDDYDILSIERHGVLVTTELRVLRKRSTSECTALLFNKYL